MAVHLLRLPAEPDNWEVTVATGQAHIVPDWPESTRFALLAAVRPLGPPGQTRTRTFWVTTKEEMDRLLTNHRHNILWFTVAKHHITEDMIERTLTDKEAAS
jgi:hypothetical protein